MRYNPHAVMVTWMLTLASGATVGGGGVREIEIKPDPPKGGEQIFTVRFAPRETAVYDQIVFDCTLQQEWMLSTPDGGKTNKSCEAGTFTARQQNVKMIKDVDCYVSFFVQLGNLYTCDMAGNSNVRTNAPVTVARMKITAYRKGKPAWRVDTRARGIYPLNKNAAPHTINTNAVNTNAVRNTKAWSPLARLERPNAASSQRLYDGNCYAGA